MSIKELDCFCRVSGKSIVVRNGRLAGFIGREMR